MDTKLPNMPAKGQEPQHFFEQLQQEMERLIDRFRGYPTIADDRSGFGISAGLRPAIDVSETEDAVEVTAEIPGVGIDDLDVSLNGDALVIKGEKSQERTEEEKNYQLNERSYGSFRRQIPLGFTPAEDAVKADFADGVLKLTITRPPEAKAANRKIAINKT